VVVQERLHGLYEFFVPLFFAVMGMMVNLREIFSVPVLIFGAVYTASAILAKLIGCGGPALLLGFNLRGALRIGAGMVPRGEVALIIAGIGLASGILDNQLFGVIILMTFITTLAAPPLLNAALRIPGPGIRKPAKGDDSASAVWDFSTPEIADLVADTLRKSLRTEGFFVQLMDIDEGLSQARKGDIALTITEEEKRITMVTNRADMQFIKTVVYEVILNLNEAIGKLKESADPRLMKQELADMEGPTREDALSLIQPDCITLNLQGETKEGVITELVDLLAARGKLTDRDLALGDVFQREKTMSTGMQHGIALPHGKTDGVETICVAVGIKKGGIDFESLDGEKSRLFILVVSPRKISGPHVQFLAAVGAVLKDDIIREEVINADSPEEAAALLRNGK
jgi:mannitol/fructose-specific phosphotransferase system IIA component (Ntr-type)